jgi:hypothetical protein
MQGLRKSGINIGLCRIRKEQEKFLLTSETKVTSKDLNLENLSGITGHS